MAHQFNCKMRNYLFVPLFVLCSSIALSQKVYKPGFAVNDHGDTLRGYIGYGNWRENPKYFNFKSHQEDGQAVRYDLSTIQYFEITGEDAYRRAIVQKDMRPVRPEDITLDTPDSLQTDTAFLRVLVVGKKISLYHLVDSKDHYYVQEAGKGPVELSWKFYMQEDAGTATGSGVQEQQIFKGQLRSYALGNDDPALLHQIDRAKYRDEDLSRIIILINGEGQARAPGNTARNSGSKPMFFGSVGVGYSTLSSSGNGNPVIGLNYKGTAGPVIAAGVDLSSPRNFGDLTFRFEVAYSQFKYTGNGSTTNFIGQAQNEKYQVQQQNISPALSMFYNFRRTHTVKYYAGLGWAFNISSYSNNVFTVTDKASGSVVSQTNAPIELSKGWQNIFLRLGSRICRKFELGVTASIFGGMTTYDNFSLDAKTYAFRALYYF
jgi:hypothetical protein